LAHKNTNKYIKNIESKSRTLNIKQFFHKCTAGLDDKAAKAELVVSAFIAEHSATFIKRTI